MHPRWWSAASTTGPSRRRTAGCWRHASPTPASSRSRTDTICKSPVRQPSRPNWWISFSIRKLRLRTRNTRGQVGKTLTGRTPAESGLLSERDGHIRPARHSLLGLGHSDRLAGWCGLIVGCDDGGIDPENPVARNRAGTEAGGENPDRLSDHLVADRVVDCQRNARRGG